VGLAGCNSHADFGIIVDAPDVSKIMKQWSMLFCATVMAQTKNGLITSPTLECG
jgi:hypothetical protein